MDSWFVLGIINIYCIIRSLGDYDVMIMMLLGSLIRYLYLANNVSELCLRRRQRRLVEQSLLISFTLSPLLNIGRAKKANFFRPPLKFIVVGVVVGSGAAAATTSYFIRP